MHADGTLRELSLQWFEEDLTEDPTKMSFVEDDDVIQTLLPGTPDPPLTMCVQQGRSHGQPNGFRPHASQHFVCMRRELAVTVVEQEASTTRLKIITA